MPRSNTKPCSRRPPLRRAAYAQPNARQTGYDPQAAERMIGLIDPHYLFAIASPTHGTNRTRAPEMTAEIAVLRTAPDAAWATRFRRE